MLSDRNFFKIRSAIYAKLCAQTFPPIFGLFTIFDHNFVKILVPPIDKNENSLRHLKRQSLLKKRVNCIKIYP